MEKISYPDAYIFDLDGTVIRFFHDKVALERLRRDLIGKIHRFTDEPLPTQSIFGLYLWVCKKYFNDIELIQSCRNLLDEYEISIADKATTHALAGEFLEHLDNKLPAVFKGLLTNNGRKLVDYIVKKYQVFMSFDKIITRDDILCIKPDTEGITKMLKPISTRQIVFIGDSDSDEIVLQEYGKNNENKESIFLHVEKLHEYKTREGEFRNIFQRIP